MRGAARLATVHHGGNQLPGAARSPITRKCPRCQAAPGQMCWQMPRGLAAKVLYQTKVKRFHDERRRLRKVQP